MVVGRFQAAAAVREANRHRHRVAAEMRGTGEGARLGRGDEHAADAEALGVGRPVVVGALEVATDRVDDTGGEIVGHESCPAV